MPLRSYSLLPWLRRAMSSPFATCVLPPLLLQLVTTLTRKLYCEPWNDTAASSSKPADGLVAVTRDKFLERPAASAELSGECLKQNFIVTKANMEFAAASRKRLIDRQAKESAAVLRTKSERLKARGKPAGSKSIVPRARVAPNYFVAIQITDPGVVQACMQVQEELLSKGGKHFAPALIKPAKFHVTLLVMHLLSETKASIGKGCNAQVVASTESNRSATEATAVAPSEAADEAAANDLQPDLPAVVSVESAREALEACGRRLLLEQPLSDARLSLCGVSAFNERVVFASVQNSTWLEAVLGIVSEEFGRIGIHSLDKRSPCLHVTLMKLTQARRVKHLGTKRFSSSFLASMTDTYLGMQTVGSLQLCAMHLPPIQESGYYHVDHEVAIARQQASRQPALVDTDEGTGTCHEDPFEPGAIARTSSETDSSHEEP